MRPLFDKLRFLYDGDGGRVKQLTPAGTTLFLGELYEVAPTGTATTYVFAGGQRLAAIQTSPAQRAAWQAQNGPAVATAAHWLWRAVAEALSIPTAEAAELAQGLRLFLPDHLGSTNLVVDAGGAVVELTEHAPYGAITRHEGTGRGAHQFTGQENRGRFLISP